MTTTVAFEDLKDLAGSPLGASRWLEVDQERINVFADVTGDHQWIHVDPERAKDGPFGGTVAHGYLTLSLVMPLWSELLDVTGVTTRVNYGLDRVRFPAPVPSGARIRLSGTLADVAEVAGGGLQLVPDLVVEIENGDKPACVLRPIFRFYP
jgi:acyl dehydratase